MVQAKAKGVQAVECTAQSDNKITWAIIREQLGDSVHQLVQLQTVCMARLSPGYAIHVSQLEKVQQFAAKVATGRWQAHGDSLVSGPGWPLL